MLSSSTYSTYISQLNTNKSIFSNMNHFLNLSLNDLKNHFDKLNNTKMHFVAGYIDESKNPLTGNLIIDACSDCEIIIKQLEELINSLTKELNNIDGYISRYRAEYDAALERERRERELAKLSFKESQMNNR